MSETKARKDAESAFMVLNQFWKTDPVSVLAKDGSKLRYTLEHRIGRPGYTMKALFELVGLEKKLADFRIQMRKEIRNDKTREKVINSEKKALKSRLRGWIRDFKTVYLPDKYKVQNLRPIMSFLPDKESEAEEKIIFIEGFINTQTLMPVVGDIDAVTLAMEIRNAKLKDAVDEYRENQAIAKKALSLPGINKDIQNRLTNIVAGNVDRLLLHERFKKEETTEGEK